MPATPATPAVPATGRAARLVAVALAAGAAAALLGAGPAAAHPGREAAGLWDGVLHPITGTDHLLAMVAVGVLAAVAAPRRGAWSLPAGFLTGVVLGGGLGLAGLPLPGAEPMILLSVVLLGAAVATAARGAGDGVLLALAAAGLAHGHAHGAEAPAAAHPLAYLGGVVLATAGLHLLGMGAGALVRRRSTLRLGLGAATTAAGVVLLTA